jgi:hypothetical protein
MKSETPERCIQRCRSDRDSCMISGRMRAGLQVFRNLDRTAEESPGIRAQFDPPPPRPMPTAR